MESEEGGDAAGALSRREGTIRKNVRLTPEALARVQRWAEENRVSFSAALESLALIGLGEAPQVAVMPAVIAAMRAEVQRQAHRLAALTAAAAVESAVTMRLVSNLILERERAKGADPEEGRARYLAIRNRARLQAVDAVRKREGLEELIGRGADQQVQVPQEGRLDER